jgi:hypothetical protein
MPNFRTFCSISLEGRCEEWIGSAKKSRYVVQDKPIQNSNWGVGADLREALVDVLFFFAITSFHRIVALYNKNLNSKKGICLR